MINVEAAARIMAVLYVHGNNEAMTHNMKFKSDLRYIQRRFDIEGAMTPDRVFCLLFRRFVKELEDADSNNVIPKWASDMFINKYGIKLR